MSLPLCRDAKLWYKVTPTAMKKGGKLMPQRYCKKLEQVELMVHEYVLSLVKAFTSDFLYRYEGISIEQEHLIFQVSSTSTSTIPACVDQVIF